MMALAMAILGAMLIAWSAALTQPKEIEADRQMRGDVAAVNFLAYRQALSACLNSPPCATVVDDPARPTDLRIPDGSLTAALTVPGYQRQPQWNNNAVTPWTNIISGGTLYTYTNGTLALGGINYPASIMMGSLRKRTLSSLALGTAIRPSLLNPAQFAPSGRVAVASPLPLVIANSAVVLIGR